MGTRSTGDPKTLAEQGRRSQKTASGAQGSTWTALGDWRLKGSGPSLETVGMLAELKGGILEKGV